MDQLLHLVIDDLDKCSREGVKLVSGERLWLVCLGNKGDWSYLVSVQQLLKLFVSGLDFI